MPGRTLVEIVSSIAARFGRLDEGLAIGAQQLQRDALGILGVAQRLAAADCLARS